MVWFRIVLSVLILLFGLVTTWSLSYKWICVGFILFSIPLLFQLSKNLLIKSYAIWFGVFLVMQSIISPVIKDRQIKTLKPNIDIRLDVRDGIPGITGLQHITTDSSGFRVTKRIDYTDGTPYRIFVMGGSTTEQIYLDDNKTWTHLLQKRLGENVNFNIEVINTGLSGTRTKHHFITLSEIAKYKPDMVIFLLGLNDWDHHIRSHFDPFIPVSFDRTFLGKFIKYRFYNLTEEEGFPKKGTKPEIVTGTDYDRKRGSLSRNVRKSFRPKSVLKSYIRYLNKIVTFCKKIDVICVFLTQPSGYQKDASEDFKRGFWMTPPDTRYTLDFESMVYISELYNDYLIEFAKRNNIYAFDLSKKIPPTYEYFYDDCHFNIHGANRVSEVLFQFLIPVVKSHQQSKI